MGIGTTNHGELAVPSLRRREFLTLLTGAAVATLGWPNSASAQRGARVRSIGFLGATTPTIWTANLTAFNTRLRELGWIEGSNLAIEYRWAEGRESRYAELAAELVQQRVEVIVTDHHLVPYEVPEGAIVVFPRQPGCAYPEKELAATGRQPGATRRQRHRPFEFFGRSRRSQT